MATMDVKEYIIGFGYSLVKNSLTLQEVTILRKAVTQQPAGKTAAGVYVLTNKGDFLDLLDHPLIDEMIPWLLSDLAHIRTYFVNITQPGNVPMQLHTNQVATQPPIRDVAFGMNIMWFLTDITEKIGETRIYPGLYRGNVAPEDMFNVLGSVAAEGSAGMALVF
ncbi:hypothetical protein HD806DRAFT_540930 [Xylariaceae sp. AK1471]|nr:hypothetical protein HD806DRAFT_540930 [Xylariaceae sp. AK1471]